MFDCSSMFCFYVLKQFSSTRAHVTWDEFCVFLDCRSGESKSISVGRCAAHRYYTWFGSASRQLQTAQKGRQWRFGIFFKFYLGFEFLCANWYVTELFLSIEYSYEDAEPWDFWICCNGSWCWASWNPPSPSASRRR